LTNIRARLTRGSLWIASAKIVNNGLLAISTIVLARLLVPDDFGIVALAGSFIAIATAFTELSLGSALINVKDPDDDHYHTVWTLGLIRALLIAACICLAANTIAFSVGDMRLEPVLYVLSLSLAISGLASSRLALLERNLEFKQAFTLSLFSNTMAFLVSLSLALIWKNYWALVIGALAGQLGRIVASFMVAPYLPKFRWNRLPDLWRFSVWLSFSQIVSTLNYRSDQLIVGWHLGRTELGYYTVGGTLAQLPGREIVAPLTATLFPALSLLRDDPSRLRAGYVRAQTLVTAIALPMTALVAAFASPAVVLFMGDQWIGAIVVVQAVAAITAFETLGSLVAPLAMAKGHTQTLFQRDLAKLVIRLPLIIAGLVFGGFIGLLLGRSIAGLTGVLIDMHLIRRIADLSITQQFIINSRSIIATAVAVTAAIFLQYVFIAPPDFLAQLLRLFCLGFLSLIIFLASAWFLWHLSGYPEGPESEFKKPLNYALERSKQALFRSR
jgi:O-antigen/teichoic acid export membrane protein